MILAGAFDRFPNITIVTGHWGQVVLFYLDRTALLSGAARLPRTISEGCVASTVFQGVPGFVQSAGRPANRSLQQNHKTWRLFRIP
jgi:predicted TIM-barrel fold metal-dependent hydrolase